MKTFNTIIILLLLANTINAQSSYIQITSEPYLSVYLDGEFKGITSSDLNGLFIKNVNAGNHKLEIKKEGYSPQIENIVIKKGEVFKYNVKSFAPLITITQNGNTKIQNIEKETGTIKIQSLPIEIRINISQLNINSLKIQDEWTAKSIPTGAYEAVFKWNDKLLRYNINVANNQTTHLFVNLIDGTVEKRNGSNDTYNERKVNESALFPGRNKSNCNSVSFNLHGRTPESLPKPEYNGQSEGKVVVEITVDKYGNVTDAVPGVRGSTTLDANLLSASKKAALRSKFSKNPDAPAYQKGTITYLFKQ